MLTFSSKGRGSVCNTKGIESLLENDEDMYFVFSGSVPGYSDGHSWVNVNFLLGGMSLSLAVLTGQGEEGFHPHETQLLVFSCLWLYCDKLLFLFFIFLDWHCLWICFNTPLRIYWCVCWICDFVQSSCQCSWGGFLFFPSSPKVFTANTNPDTVVSHELDPPIRARYIRFRPLSWHNQISMRIELYGCAQGT